MSSGHYTALLGLAFEGDGLSASLLKRNGGQPHVREAFSAPLSLDPLSGDPQLVGLEIKTLLKERGVRARACVVCIPLQWVFCFRTTVPEMPDDDFEDYLAVQAERELVLPPENLCLSASRFRTELDAEGATVAAVRTEHVTHLLAVLKAAGLRTVAVTLGVTCVSDTDLPDTGTALALVLGEGWVDMAVYSGGGVVTMRRIEGSGPRATAESQAEMLARHVRITAGELPDELGRSLRAIRLFGATATVSSVAEHLGNALAGAGIDVQATTPRGAPETRPGGGNARAWKAAEAYALAGADVCLRGSALRFEFRPALKQAARARLQKKALRFSGRLAVLLVLAAVAGAGMVVIQRLELKSLTDEWEMIEPGVKEIEELRDGLRALRPWLTDQPQCLAIARLVTEAFPEEGTVWATSLQVNEQSEVTVAGKARDRTAWLAMQDRLRQSEGVRDLRISRTRDNPEGKDAMSFSIHFRWQPGATHAD